MSGSPRVSYLGPPGTFSGDALRVASAGESHDAAAYATIADALRAVAEERAELAFVPIENSIEGSVRPTLDALAFDVPQLEIVGEYDHPISQALIAAAPAAFSEITEVHSHPQAAAQCARFLRAELPSATIVAAPSTADAIRSLAGGPPGRAALGAAGAAELYGGVVLAEAVEDEPGNVTRFVWVARADLAEQRGGGTWRTTLIFAELGEDEPGALVAALVELSSRGVNMTRIESRPRREGLGRYMFFLDLDGRSDDPRVAEAISALRSKAASVRVLGSYPIGRTGVPGGGVG
ncbi:prephenate dehydratase [Thermoleophilia bacterium SCSIO 60948]|nr:prephenate dehydratase [Thermoleophilia bacterium SCSIO 60948]